MKDILWSHGVHINESRKVTYFKKGMYVTLTYIYSTVECSLKHFGCTYLFVDVCFWSLIMQCYYLFSVVVLIYSGTSE